MTDDDPRHPLAPAEVPDLTPPTFEELYDDAQAREDEADQAEAIAVADKLRDATLEPGRRRELEAWRAELDRRRHQRRHPEDLL